MKFLYVSFYFLCVNQSEKPVRRKIPYAVKYEVRRIMHFQCSTSCGPDSVSER